jgi:glutaminase
VPADLFGICVAATNGAVFEVGDTDVAFSVMSVSKPFVFALVCQAIGATRAREQLGANATGLPFNSIAAIERSPDGRTNPMVNAGAIATTSLVPGRTVDDKWRFIHTGLSKFAARTLPLNEEVYASASETNSRNQGIARVLHSYDRIYMEPAEATDLYTRQCSLNVTARDLAVMGATLADGGINPITKERAGVPLHAGRDDHGRPLRDVGRLAVRHRPAGQERHRRGHRHRFTGERRSRHICAAARRGRQQRQGTTGGA